MQVCNWPIDHLLWLPYPHFFEKIKIHLMQVVNPDLVIYIKYMKSTILHNPNLALIIQPSNA